MRAYQTAVLVCSICCALTFRAVAKDPTPHLDSIEVRLVYKINAKLSENIAPPARFVGWNTITGSGDANEPADDLLVLVRLSVGQDEANSNTPLTISATDSKGKLLERRVINSLFYKKGKTSGTLFLPDATCAGKIHIQAVFGSQKKATDINLNCGE